MQLIRIVMALVLFNSYYAIGQQYTVIKYVWGASSGVAANSEYSFKSTAGQLVSGSVQNNAYKADIGFWYMAVNNPVPVNTAVTGIVAADKDTCYNAFQTITVAGNGTTFIVQNGGSATMIAGQKIIYREGTTVEPGGNLHGYITIKGPYCGTMATSIVSVGSVENLPPLTSAPFFLKVYPNPASGQVRFEFQINEDANAKLDIYTLNGKHINRIFDGDLKAGIIQAVMFDQSLQSGIYPSVLTWKGEIITIKLIIRQ